MMPKITVQTKEQQMQLVWLRVKQSPHGITESEIAQSTGIHKRTVNNYLRSLQDEGKVEKQGKLWLLGDYEEIRSLKLEVTPEEAYTYYLGSRLFVKQQDKRNRLAEAALMKLADALTANQLVGYEIAQAARELAQRPGDTRYETIFQTIVRGYLQRKRVAITYKPLNGRVFETNFETYLMEPSAIGYATYIIGHSQLQNQRRAYKLERIERAELLNEHYLIPDDFPGLEILRNSWSIIMGEETVKVVLRFSPSVKARVLETQWHPSQKHDHGETKSAHDWLTWWVSVADTMDMLPWIRGWGADVEVIEPKPLREEMKREAQRLGEVYQLSAMPKQFIAHIREKDNVHQSLLEHLSAVADLTSQFSRKIGLKETGLVLGLLHDLGKASDKFQRYILSGEGLIDPDAEEYIDPIAHKGKIDHTTAGAQVVYQNLWNKGQKERIAAQILALCIASHHSGLIDCLTSDGENNFKRRMEKPDENTRRAEAVANLHEIQGSLEDLFSSNVVEQIFTKLKSLQEENGDSKETSVFKAGLLIRFLLSCLIDADRLDTADFEMPGNARLRNYNQYHSWEILIQRLNGKIAEYDHKPNRNEVDELRSQVSQACLNSATKPKGIYQLTVPTGGGKTLASLRFALNHAASHKMDRIFYVIPYTSIIDQNADEVRKILEDRDKQDHYLDRVVLEHHSNLTPEEESRRQNLLAQNWDAPVVFTTQVQFLETLFGSGTRSPRRMHQLANSVIILDEAQTIPIKTIHMLNIALRFLVNNCGATVVLCTATQPPLDKIDAQSRALTIQPDMRIIQNENELFERLKRVEVVDGRKVGGWSEEETAELVGCELQKKGSVLIVVNTKRSARALYHAIATKKIAGVGLYHLSTNMCAVHRLQILEEIKDKLRQEEPVICVSTQLIEAGVDIDFGSVIRYLAGLDSIAQSAGRCNRHGTRQGLGNVWIINPKNESIEKLKDIVIGIKHAQRVLDDFKVNPVLFGENRIGIEAMAAYYKFYYNERKNEMKYNIGPDSRVGRDDNLFSLLSTNPDSMAAYCRAYEAIPDIVFPQSFQTASKEFHVIDSPTRGVIVPYKDEGREIVAELCGAVELEKQFKLLKRAQRYSVNLFFHEFARLAEAGAIQEVQAGTGVYYLDERYYSDDFGWSDEVTNDMRLQIV